MTSNECAIGTTQIPNAKINQDTLLGDGMRNGDFFTVIYTPWLSFYAVVAGNPPTLTQWPTDTYYPVPLTLDGKTITPGDALRGEHGRKFEIKGNYWQLDLSDPDCPRFVDC